MSTVCAVAQSNIVDELPTNRGLLSFRRAAAKVLQAVQAWSIQEAVPSDILDIGVVLRSKAQVFAILGTILCLGSTT